MARGRNGAPKKSGKSSSMDKGRAKGIYARACSGVPFPEKKKMGFKSGTENILQKSPIQFFSLCPITVYLAFAEF